MCVSSRVYIMIKPVRACLCLCVRVIICVFIRICTSVHVHTCACVPGRHLGGVPGFKPSSYEFIVAINSLKCIKMRQKETLEI